MAKKKHQTKGVFCLETASWDGIRDRSSMEHVLRLLETTYRVSYLHFDVGTREEFDFHLKKWGQAKVGATYPILYLGFHGAPGKIKVGEGSHGSITLDDLAERLESRCGGRIIHFGSCDTLAVHGRELKRFLARTEALAVCGYKEEVAWRESAAFDLLVLGRLQDASFLQVSSVEKFNRKLKDEASGLYGELGFRMWIRH